MFANKLRNISQRIEQIAKDVIQEYANKIFTEAVANLSGNSLQGQVRLEVHADGLGATIVTGSEILAYIEFGTGEYARQYLSGKPQELVNEAQKFYVNGTGTIPAHPWLFPVFYKYRDEIQPEFDRRLQQFFNSL